MSDKTFTPAQIFWLLSQDEWWVEQKQPELVQYLPMLKKQFEIVTEEPDAFLHFVEEFDRDFTESSGYYGPASSEKYWLVRR